MLVVANNKKRKLDDGTPDASSSSPLLATAVEVKFELTEDLKKGITALFANVTDKKTAQFDFKSAGLLFAGWGG